MSGVDYEVRVSMWSGVSAKREKDQFGKPPVPSEMGLHSCWICSEFDSHHLLTA